MTADAGSMRNALSILASSVLLWGCTQRPVNPPLKGIAKNASYEFEHLERNSGKKDDLIILAFSGGGTRAAAFSYGVLETLRRIERNGHDVFTARARVPRPRQAIIALRQWLLT